ncbi:MAG: peptidylprolyl isomerase [Dehalococcoidia bacterium]|nr:peptidylprolyl isomerase [Dehalococcoidia bacterium]
MFKLSHIILAVVFILGAVLTGCKSTPPVAKSGDTVQVNYTGKLADGTVFDSSVGSEPYEFTLGMGQTIAGFDKAVIGMKVGDKKTVIIPADDAYGQHLDDMVIQVSRDRIRSDKEPQVGQILEATREDGQTVRFTIAAVSDNGTVTLDANHPLAGKDLTFDIELVKINK